MIKIKKMRRVLFILSIAILLTSCNKDDDNNPSDSNSVYGKWTVENSSGFMLKHLIIENDGQLYFLDEGDYGFRYKYEETAIINESSITIDSDWILGYTLNGSTLTLSSEEWITDIVLTRNDAAPTFQDWVKTKTPSISIDSPINSTSDLSFHDQSIWLSDGNSPSQLYKINVNSLSSETSISVNHRSRAIEWANGNLWVSDNQTEKIYKIDFPSGNDIEESSNIYSAIFGIGYDGSEFWCASPVNNTGAVIRYNPNSNSVSGTFNISDGNTNGITCGNGFVYVCGWGVINKCTMNPFEVVDAYSLDNNGYVEGLTINGSDIWVSSRYSNGSTSYKIEKIEL